MVTVQHPLIMRCLLLACVCAASPLAAAPMRVNVDGKGTQDLTQGEANEALSALFEMAGVRALPPEADEEVELPVMTTVDPQQGSPVLDSEPKASTSSTLHDEWLLTTRSLPGQPSAEDAAQADARGLGGFMPPAPAAMAREPDPVDSTPLPGGEEEPAPADPVAVAAAAIDVEALKQQRHTIQWVVAPLVLVVMLVALATSGRQSRRRARHKVKRG